MSNFVKRFSDTLKSHSVHLCGEFKQMTNFGGVVLALILWQRVGDLTCPAHDVRELRSERQAPNVALGYTLCERFLKRVRVHFDVEPAG